MLDKFGENNKIMCWKTEWVHPFESPLSIIEKIKMSNCISSNAVIKEFGRPELRYQPSPTTSSKKLDLYTLNGFDHNLLVEINFDVENYLGFIRKVHNKPSFQPRGERFSKYIIYCKECMKYNFHSIFHQLFCVFKCPFHNTPIYQGCSLCGKNLYYLLQYHDHFLCKCGNRINATNHPVWNNWDKTFHVINDIGLHMYL